MCSVINAQSKALLLNHIVKAVEEKLGKKHQLTQLQLSDQTKYSMVLLRQKQFRFNYTND
jgi:hypothetical protein